MKIYYIYSNLPSYRRDFFAGLSRALKNQGIELEVLHGMQTNDKVVAQDDNSDYTKNAFDSIRRKIGPIKFTVIKNLFKHIKNGQPDGIVISYMSTNLTMLRVVLYCIAKKIPYATWRCGYNRPDYSNISNKIRQYLIKFVEKKATLNITYGSQYKSFLEKKGINTDKIIIAQNTINIEKILEENNNNKRHFTAKSKILFVGALIKGKLLQSSIDAVKLLVDDGYDVCFHIVGGGTIIEEIKKYISDLHLENSVYVTGPKYKEDVKRYFNESDIFLLAGTGGLAINEAMAYGLPIISTNADGTVCDLINGNGYFMSEFGNSNMQYHFLKKFIELSPEEKCKMSDKSKEIIKSKASLENMITKHHLAINYLTQNK